MDCNTDTVVLLQPDRGYDPDEIADLHSPICRPPPVSGAALGFGIGIDSGDGAWANTAAPSGSQQRSGSVRAAARSSPSGPFPICTPFIVMTPVRDPRPNGEARP